MDQLKSKAVQSARSFMKRKLLGCGIGGWEIDVRTGRQMG